MMRNLIVSSSSSVKFVSDKHCRTVVVRAAQFYHYVVVVVFIDVVVDDNDNDGDDEKPVRTETNALALLSHEVSVTVLHKISFKFVKKEETKQQVV